MTEGFSLPLSVCMSMNVLTDDGLSKTETDTHTERLHTVSKNEVIKELRSYIESRIVDAECIEVMNDKHVRTIMYEGTLEVVNHVCDTRELDDATRKSLHNQARMVLIYEE